jgi:phosphonate transport system ATP-binding protein
MRLTLDSLHARHPAAPKGRDALRGINLALQPGEQVAVIGPSGAGKTTLLQVAAAALKPALGTLQLDGTDPWQLGTSALQQLRGQLFLAPQVPPLPPRQRVVTAVLAGRLPAWGLLKSLRSLFYPADIPGAHAALDRFGLADKLFARVDRLSGGERQRVARPLSSHKQREGAV